MPQCPNCRIEMEEGEPSFENMTEGQLADYKAGLWRFFSCPECGYTDFHEGHFAFSSPDEEEGAARGYSSETKKVKQEIPERDNHTCQMCRVREKDLGYVLHVHHIFGLSDCEPDSLVSLCAPCHGKAHLLIGEIERRLKAERFEKVQREYFSTKEGHRAKEIFSEVFSKVIKEGLEHPALLKRLESEDDRRLKAEGLYASHKRYLDQLKKARNYRPTREEELEIFWKEIHRERR